MAPSLGASQTSTPSKAQSSRHSDRENVRQCKGQPAHPRNKDSFQALASVRILSRVAARDFGQLSCRARRALCQMRRRPTLVGIFWELAELFPLFYRATKPMMPRSLLRGDHAGSTWFLTQTTCC
jgi:hypothetical protein